MHSTLQAFSCEFGALHAFKSKVSGSSSLGPFEHKKSWPESLSLSPGQVQSGLNLCLRLKSPAQMPALLAAIKAIQDQTDAALSSLRYVHFARFLPTMDGSQLWVITVFDGDLQSYLMDFVKVLGDPFNAMLAFVVDAPRLPVQQYPRDFCDWVHNNNEARVLPWSAYKDLSVLDILSVKRHA
jgi:hypothetical protein